MQVNQYKVSNGKGGFQPVSAKHAKEAAAIDTNGNGVVEDDEIKAHLQKTNVLSANERANVPRVVDEFKHHLKGTRPSGTDSYHSYDDMVANLQSLATAHPDRAQLQSIGKTQEGRDLWALKISSGLDQTDTSNKPGIVFTGCHHAREWASMEVPLNLANELVNNYDSNPDIKRRVDNAEIWVLPMVNPDGYEYSRTEDNWWRKNRNPIMETPCSSSTDGQPLAIGVDLNRNYQDSNPDHATIYRPVGDTPCDTSDDFGVTSDDPNDDTYRGPSGSSEKEVQALLNLELTHPNIKGVIDHHGYGEMLLHPWGWTEQPPDNAADYDAVGQRMLDAQTNKYNLMPSIQLYPTAGTSTDTLHANGKWAFTIELGTSFQPPESDLPDLKQNVGAADYAFLDWVLEKSTPPPAPTPDPTPPAPAPDPAPPSAKR